MKQVLLFFIASFLVLSSFAQDKIINDPNAEQRTVSSFHALQVSQGIDVILKQGSTEAVAVSAVETEYRDRIKTEVINGVLKIYYDIKLWKELKNRDKKLKAYVSFKNLDRLNCSSGAEVKIDGSLNTATLAVNLSSGGRLTGDIKATSLEIEQSSGST